MSRAETSSTLSILPAIRPIHGLSSGAAPTLADLKEITQNPASKSSAPVMITVDSRVHPLNDSPIPQRPMHKMAKNKSFAGP